MTTATRIPPSLPSSPPCAPVRDGADAIALVGRLSGAPELGRALTLWLVLLTVEAGTAGHWPCR